MVDDGKNAVGGEEVVAVERRVAGEGVEVLNEEKVEKEVLEGMADQVAMGADEVEEAMELEGEQEEQVEVEDEGGFPGPQSIFWKALHPQEDDENDEGGGGGEDGGIGFGLFSDEADGGGGAAAVPKRLSNEEMKAAAEQAWRCSRENAGSGDALAADRPFLQIRHLLAAGSGQCLSMELAAIVGAFGGLDWTQTVVLPKLSKSATENAVVKADAAREALIASPLSCFGVVLISNDVGDLVKEKLERVPAGAMRLHPDLLTLVISDVSKVRRAKEGWKRGRVNL